MSTRVDILAAKAAYDDHNAEHKCAPAYLRSSSLAACPVRTRLWRLYMACAGNWGIQPTDAARVAEQYAWQTALLGQRVAA